MPTTTCTDRGCRWRLAELAGGDDLAHALMDMGSVVIDAGNGRVLGTYPAAPPADAPAGHVVTLYKHGDTRRYLNLGMAGDAITAWRYIATGTGYAYRPIPLAEALAHVVE